MSLFVMSKFKMLMFRLKNSSHDPPCQFSDQSSDRPFEACAGTIENCLHISEHSCRSVKDRSNLPNPQCLSSHCSTFLVYSMCERELAVQRFETSRFSNRGIFLNSTAFYIAWIESKKGGRGTAHRKYLYKKHKEAEGFHLLESKTLLKSGTSIVPSPLTFVDSFPSLMRSSLEMIPLAM